MTGMFMTLPDIPGEGTEDVALSWNVRSFFVQQLA